jgi:cell division protein ZapA
MPHVEIMIGGRSFEVACQAGEEPFLISAAQMLDTEASTLSSQIGRMPEARMLLMAGLMLADKTAGLEERLAEAEHRIALMTREIAELQAAEPVAVTERVEVVVEVPVEVPVVPQDVRELLDELVARTEELARKADYASSKA